MAPNFVHLRLHTEYSISDGLVRIGPLMEAVAAAGMPAVALTDQSNLFALVRFYKAAIKQGIKPLIGVDVWVEGEDGADCLVLLCQNNTGYLHLTQLISQSYLEGQASGRPVLQRDWLAAASSGLLALSGGREGDIGKALTAGRRATAEARLAYWHELFPGRFYLELQRTGRPGDEDYLHAAVELAGATATPVVATNDVRFLQTEDFEAHEVRVGIHDGYTLDDPRRPRRFSEQQYLRGPAEMAELFADIPEALDNTLAIAQRCNVTLTLGENVLPEFPLPAGTTTETYFREQAWAGLRERLAATPAPAAAPQAYEERLARELDVICSMGFPGYFLIVADFIQWAKAQDVPVGPGRGSGAGSLVAYALQITDLDPLKYDLLFERFLNPERVSMPDFDVDFCMDGRDQVIEYVAERYGREKVSQIITYGTMAARAAVRDVGRVLGYGYNYVDRIAKLIPFKPGANISLEQALEDEPDFREQYDKDEDVRGLVDMARKVEGLTRNAGTHAGGVVIAPTALTEFTPLYCEAPKPGEAPQVVSQFDKDDVEAVGLVKFDFLGLRTLTIIDHAVKIANSQRAQRDEPPLDIQQLPLEDALTFALLKRADTTAVFQLESQGMKELMKRLAPDCFEDIIALVALYRPGPLGSGMVNDFVARKHGQAKVEYPHPKLEPILKPTYGTILYQEQVMQCAQELAGYTLGGADLLRRAMGKKKQEEMDKQRALFIEGAVERGVAESQAAYIFDLIAEFAKYGFNKSHSAAYALLSYQTAWLKTHYPAAFMASVLSADMDNTDKIVTLIEACRSMDLQVEPPNVNRSEYRFTAHDERTIWYGLGAIKGVGEAALHGLLQDRQARGPFKDLPDLCQRMDLGKVNRRVLEALIRAGALDELGSNRASLMAQLPQALRSAEQHQRDREMGQVGLFGNLLEEATVVVADPGLPEWQEAERLRAEKETLGLYLTGHPVTRYETELRALCGSPIADLLSRGADTQGKQERKVTVAGLIVAVRSRNTQSGRMGLATLDDRTARIEVKLFGETFDAHKTQLVKDRVVVVKGALVADDYSDTLQVRASEVADIETARGQNAKALRLELQADSELPGLSRQLAEVLTPYRHGPCRVLVNYRNHMASADLRLGQDWSVRPADDLIGHLNRLLGEQRVQIHYS